MNQTDSELLKVLVETTNTIMETTRKMMDIDLQQYDHLNEMAKQISEIKMALSKKSE